MYQPWHKRHSLPPYCPYLERLNISPYNEVNTINNGQGSNKERITTSDGPLWLIHTVVHMTTSSSEWRQEQGRSHKSRSHRCMAQLAIQKEAYGPETMRNALLKQWRERGIDWGLCWETHPWGKKARWSRRVSNWGGAGRCADSWKRAIDD